MWGLIRRAVCRVQTPGVCSFLTHLCTYPSICLQAEAMAKEGGSKAGRARLKVTVVSSK